MKWDPLSWSSPRSQAILNEAKLARKEDASQTHDNGESREKKTSIMWQRVPI